jgi:hypothetical protein
LNPFIRYLKESYAGICVNKPISEPLEGATRQAIKSMKQVSA